MGKDEYKGAIAPNKTVKMPEPPKKCDGQLYTIKASDTLYNIGQRFRVTVQQITAANPQIKNPNVIYVGQVICIPNGKPKPEPDDRLRVLSLHLLTEAGQPLPTVNGAVELTERVIVRATFNRPIFRAFFFLEPTGTETCELARLIGIHCPGAATAEIIWHVPAGTLGRVFVIGCDNSICAKSEEILVVRDT